MLNKFNNLWLWFKQSLHRTPSNKQDLILLMRTALHRGLIDAETLSMIEGVLLFSNLKVRDVMLPKKQIIGINQTDSLQVIIDKVAQLGHSRFPVFSDHSDHVIGILHAKDLLAFINTDDHEFDLLDIIRQTAFVPESKRVDVLLNEFRINRNHMAIVVDEYGGVSGFITLEDILEQIIGEIADEFDIDEETYIRTHGKHCYIIKAHMPIDEFNEHLKAHLKHDNYDTLGGIIMANFGYLPKRGEIIHIQDFSFKIIHADGRRIKLLECIDQRTKPLDHEHESKHSNH